MKADFKNRYPIAPANQDQLIESCRRGDHKAQLQIYKLFYKPIYSICLGIKKEPASAEYLMHESFLLAFDNISSYTGNVSFTSWLILYVKFAVNKEALPGVQS